MPIFTSIFLVLSLAMAVVVGGQTRSWTWGPAMLPLGVATLLAIVSIWRSDRKLGDLGLTILGIVVAGWFAWRAWISPVHELAQADLFLLAGTVATYLCIRAITGHKLAERVLIWGLALLLLANIVVVGKQIMEPAYNPVFRSSTSAAMVSGFYFHYNEAANFFIASSMIVFAAGLFGKNRLPIRILWILIAIAGLICVFYTRSRGGILGMAIAIGILTVFGLVIAKRNNSRGFAPMLIALPILGFGIVTYLIIGWQASQELRHAGSGIEQLFDNNARLYFLGMALSCIGLHPLLGGGSRSFSWECFRFADAKAQGDIVTHRPEQVHNELLQAATDYGLIGVGVLIVLLVTLVILVIFKVLFEDREKNRDPLDDVWRLGAIAALAGMLVQSSFSFVFHLFPGVMLLGICLGQMARSANSKSKSGQVTGNKVLLSLAAVGCCLLLIPFGWKGTRITYSLWPVFFSKDNVASLESRIEKISLAITQWPQTELHQERAISYLALANSETVPAMVIQAKEAAIKDYRQATRLHPFDPSFLINGANLLSDLERDKEAEMDYAKAIQLQGGMEPAFRGNLSSSIHYLKKGIRQFTNGNLPEALRSLEIASDQIESACKEMHWILKDMVETRVAIHESLGTVREASGDLKGAMESYEFAAVLQGGGRANYRVGSLYGKLASQAWTARRPSEALGYFNQARQHIAITQNLPQGVTPSQRVEYLAYLDQTIAFLKAAKVTPPPDKLEN